MAAFTKKSKAYKVGHWKISQLKFSNILGRDATIKEEEGRCWHERLCFPPLPLPLPHHTTEVPQQGQIPPSFRTDYLGMGVEESQFARQGRMVSGGVPQGF